MRSALLLATLLLIAAALTLQACGSREGASRTSEVVDSAGIRIVYSHEPRWPEGRGWRVDAEPLLSIGTVEGPEAYMFSRVSGAARLSDGRIVVLNGAPRQVRLYGSDGAFLRGVGGPGQGPGEFQALSQVLVGPGDTLVVWDSQAYRVTRFSPEGDFSRTDTFDRSRLSFPGWMPEMIRLLPDGGLLLRLYNVPISLPEGPFHPEFVALRASPDASMLDTLLIFTGTERWIAQMPGGPQRLSLTPPHEQLIRDFVSFRRSPSPLCIGIGTAEVACHDMDRSETRIRWRPRPVPVSDEDVTAWRSTSMSFMTRGFPEAEADRLLSRLAIPATRPAYDRLLLDRGGNLWARKPGTWLATDEPPQFTVFDPDGVWLGEVTLPAVVPLEIGEDHVIGLHRDALGVETVRVYALVRGGG